LLTPTKITAWLGCPHFLTLRGAADAGQLEVPAAGIGSFARLLIDKGLEHERDVLAEFRAAGLGVHLVPPRRVEPFTVWAERSRPVLDAGYDVVYQQPLVHDGIRGIADFLVRVDTPSRLGAFSYEPLDAKLARAEAKPGHVLQLCFYADALEALQGVAPANVHLHLGNGVRETIRLSEVRPYWRRIRRQLRRALDSDDADTKARPCDQCAFCEFAPMCETDWRSADSPHYVAGLRRDEITALSTAGVTTLTALAEADPARVTTLRAERLSRLQTQARLQRAAVEGSPPPYQPLPPDGQEERRLLPEPDEADVILDFEGDPFWTPAAGLFFLFGALVRDADGDWQYEQRWAHNRHDEAQMTAEVMEWLAARHGTSPGMHVYHYNHTERSSLMRLAAEHGTGEDRLATLVDAGVFVDLYDVLKHAVVVGVESYGLKSVEALTRFERTHDVDRGAGAIVQYDRWTRDRQETRLTKIAQYNEDDVRATLALRDWLLSEPLNGEPWRAPIGGDETTTDALDIKVEGLIATGDATNELLAHLLGYWAREGRAHRAQHLASLAADEDDQCANPDVVCGLELDRMNDPVGRQRIERAVFRFPDQEIGPQLTADRVRLMYPVDADGVITVTCDEVDVAKRELVVAWRAEAADAGVLPKAMVLNDWVAPGSKPEALFELADAVLAGIPCLDGAIGAMLRRELPRFTPGHGPAGGTFTGPLPGILDELVHLDASYVAVQGPPGTGKTFIGAQLIHRLVAAGKRVGITAFSHAAIDNLIQETLSQHPDIRVLRQTPGSDGIPLLPSVTYDADRSEWDTGGHDVLAGTTWLFARPEMRLTPAVDYLIIDEAGQLGLADAIAAGTSARNIVLLGDPLQLAHVTQATHPGGAGASVLRHVIGDAPTIPIDRGVFLDVTRRMHPAVSVFISEQVYEGRLQSHPDCAHQSVGEGTGLRWLRVEHEGRSTMSPEEADIIAAAIRELVGQTWTAMDGTTRPLVASDVMVVAPYNDHVDLLRQTLDADPDLCATRVGTVDRFQGQEAAVVFFSMATSSATDMPRNSEFLFSRHRLNVAVSRARALAVVVCTEELLDTRAHRLDDMKLISTLCDLVDRAGTSLQSADSSR
jgi:uncharacterized protein